MSTLVQRNIQSKKFVSFFRGEIPGLLNPEKRYPENPSCLLFQFRCQIGPFSKVNPLSLFAGIRAVACSPLPTDTPLVHRGLSGVGGGEGQEVEAGGLGAAVSAAR